MNNYASSATMATGGTTLAVTGASSFLWLSIALAMIIFGLILTWRANRQVKAESQMLT